MKARRWIAAAVALAWGHAAMAQPSGLRSCEDAGLGLESVAVGEDRSGVRTFYQGNVTLLVVDMVEPACCAFGVAIVMPAPPQSDEPVGMSCWAVTGYPGVDLQGARAQYDARRGLMLTIPAQRYVADSGVLVAGDPIRLRIDAGRGLIEDLDAARR